MGGRGGSAVGAVVVAPGTSSSVGRVLGNRDVELQFFRLQKLDRKIAYCCIRRCSLVLSASSAVSAFLLLLLLFASAAGASAAAATAAATALRTAGWSCSVFYFLL